MNPTFQAWLAMSSLSLSVAATASTVTTYTDEATFGADTGSGMLTLPNVNSSTVTIAGRLKIESATAGTIEAGNLNPGSYLPTYWNLAPNYLVKNAVENLDLTPLETVYAIGFTLYEPTSTAQVNGCNWTCEDSTFEIELFSGASLLASYSIEPPDNAFNFYGFWSTDAITKVTIRETVGGVDNEFFGRFMTGTSPNVALPAPEPGSLALVGLGLAALGVRRRPEA